MKHFFDLLKLASTLFLFCLIFSCKNEKPTLKVENNNAAVVKSVPIIKYGFNIKDYTIFNDTIESGESFGLILDRHHVPYPIINAIATQVKDTFDIRRIKAGKPYTILKSKDSTEKPLVFIYKHNKVNATIINFQDSLINAYTFKKPVKIVEKIVSGKIKSSFSKAMDTIGLSSSLSSEVADIYAWTVDFLRLQKDDTFKLIFEEKFINDTISVGHGKIKAAIFNHRGKNLYAFRYVADSINKIPDYYDETAGVLRRQFLKSPIQFKYRISSRYNLRRRIALYGNKVRPHRGTDFAAPIGTPIMSTANGTVIESARRGGNGNYVKVRHNTTYTTQYLHMKRRKVKVGDYVKQGDIIGWVGMTGNTSGPHVCYRFWKNGSQVDPFKQKLPSAKPMDSTLKPKYLEFIKPLKEKLKGAESIPSELDSVTKKPESNIIAEK